MARVLLCCTRYLNLRVGPRKGGWLHEPNAFRFASRALVPVKWPDPISPNPCREALSYAALSAGLRSVVVNPRRKGLPDDQEIANACFRWFGGPRDKIERLGICSDAACKRCCGCCRFFFSPLAPSRATVQAGGSKSVPRGGGDRRTTIRR